MRLAPLLLVLAPRIAAADPPPRLLVLPLPTSDALDGSLARTFDARLLVALDDTKRVVTVTPTDEPECTTLGCLAELGAAANAPLVLSMTVVKEPGGLTLFGTIVDAKTGTAARRVELARIEPTALPRTGPAELVPQIVGRAPGPTVVGVAPARAGIARTLALVMTDRLTELRAFRVVGADAPDRSALTHRADISIADLTIDEPRRHLCTFLDGTLVGTFTLTDLATGKVVFTKTVTVAVSRRAAFSSRAKVTDLLLERAAEDWMAAFQDARVAVRLRDARR